MSSIAFRENDFEELIFSYIFVNQTSGTDCKDFQRIEANSFSKEGIKLRVPRNSCANGHHLMLLIFEDKNPNIPKIIPQNGDVEGIHMLVIGKVVSKEDLNDGINSLIEFKFHQFNIDLWEEIIEKYRQKQLQIDNIFTKINKHE